MLIIVSYTLFSDTTGLLDVVYSIDATSSNDDLREMKKHVDNAVKPLNVDNGEARVGLISFANVPTMLDDFSKNDKSRLSLALDFIGQTPSTSSATGALAFVKEKFFNPAFARAQAKKLIIMFVNGNKQAPDTSRLEPMLMSLNSSNIGYVLISNDRTGVYTAALRRVAEKYGKVIRTVSNRELPDALPTIIEAGEKEKGMFC